MQPDQTLTRDSSHQSAGDTVLAERLGQLELQIARLNGLLSEQTIANRRRRRRFSIRLMLVSLVIFAGLFAWVAAAHRQSLRQSQAVDRLLDQNAFVYYRPSESMLVGLLPGEPGHPPQKLAKVLGDDFFRSVVNVSTARAVNAPRDKELILKSLSALPKLQLLRLTNLTLQNSDLDSLSDLDDLRSLDLSRTGLHNGSISWLRDANLRWFNASHTRFDDLALEDLMHSRELQYLHLERTAVTDAGVKQLSSMPTLRYLNLRRCPVSRGTVESLSKSLPGCRIEWEPLIFQANGDVDTAASARARLRLGSRKPSDPRHSKRAIAPMDSPPSSVTNAVWGAYGQTYNNTMQLDVF